MKRISECDLIDLIHFAVFLIVVVRILQSKLSVAFLLTAYIQVMSRHTFISFNYIFSNINLSSIKNANTKLFVKRC